MVESNRVCTPNGGAGTRSGANWRQDAAEKRGGRLQSVCQYSKSLPSAAEAALILRPFQIVPRNLPRLAKSEHDSSAEPKVILSVI